MLPADRPSHLYLKRIPLCLGCSIISIYGLYAPEAMAPFPAPSRRQFPASWPEAAVVSQSVSQEAEGPLPAGPPVPRPPQGPPPSSRPPLGLRLTPSHPLNSCAPGHQRRPSTVREPGAGGAAGREPSAGQAERLEIGRAHV